jgi:LPS sulfotransferase NodH
LSTGKGEFVRRPPHHAYLVCATPRSGSTLLCELLGATGTAGRPLEHFEVLRHSGLPRQPREYFEGVDDDRILDRLPPLAPAPEPVGDETPEEWWQRILSDGTTPNGVWAGKLMWGHVDDFVARARRLDGLAGADLDTVLRRLLGAVRFVRVTRPDTVEQAVSLWRAVQTQAWRSPNGHGPAADDAAYVFEGIHHLCRQLARQGAAWERWCAEHGHEMVDVSYAELSADPRGTAERVLRALDLPTAGVPEPQMRRQSDERSRRWIERYRTERDAVRA